MTPDTGILTQLLIDFRHLFSIGVGNLKADTNWLLMTLITIDLVMAILLNLGDLDYRKLLIEKILKYGFFIFLVTNYYKLANVILQSFAMIGLKAGGWGITSKMLTDPSALSEHGIKVAQPIFNHITSYSGMDVMFNLGDIILSTIMGLLIIGSFFVMGIQFFITYLEFYIVGCVALILIPFGANKYTAFLGEKAIGAVISFGIKLMVLSFIASATIPLVSKWVLPESPTFQMMLYTLLGSLAIAFLSMHAPTVAAGLLSGAPSFSAGMAAGAAMAGAGAAGVAKSALGSAAGGIMSTAGATVQAAKMGAAQGGGLKGATQGVKNLAAASSSFGQGKQNAYRSMAHQGMAMRAAGMKGRLKKDDAA